MNNEESQKECRGFAGKIPVYCRFDAIVPIEDIIPNPKNYNRHPERQLKMLAKIIQSNGWRNPVKISKLSGYVVSGHGRIEVVKLIGATHVPVEYQSYKSEKEEYEDLIADNRIALLADEDTKILNEILNDDEINIDTELAGISSEAIGMLAKSFDPHNSESSIKVLFPIVILKDRDEYDLFQELKQKYGLSSDEAMFTLCLNEMTKKERNKK